MSLIVDVTKRLGSFTLQTAFATETSITGLLGASGSGKSMTLKCIAGVEKPDDGHIELDGITLFDKKRGIDLPPQQRKVGYLFQSYALFPNMTVSQNILCGLQRQSDRHKREQECSRLITILQLNGLENHRPAQLSGGQKQRTALARILASQPQMLLLDEPFSALDGHLRDKLQLEMLELLKSLGRDALLVTHNRDEVYHMCGKTAVMENGRMIAYKATKELFSDPGTACAARLTGCKNIAAAIKTGSYSMEVPEWGVTLVSAQPLKENLTAVGIRAHYFNVKSPQNRMRIVFTGEMEEPFEWILSFRFQGQEKDSPDLWWRLPKDRRPAQLPEEFGVASVNVLPLYDAKEPVMDGQAYGEGARL